MSKRIVAILAAVMMVGMIVPSFAAVESIKVSGGVDMHGVYRNNFDMMDDGVTGNKDTQHFFQTTVRVQVEAALSSNVQAVVSMINERTWGQDFDMIVGRGVDIDLAYVKLNELMGGILTVGRQPLLIGEGMVVGSAYRAFAYPTLQVGNVLGAADLGTQTAFDAVRMEWAMQSSSLQLFVAKIVETFVGANFGTLPTGDVTLYGIDWCWKPEIFSVNPYIVALSAAQSTTGTNLYTLGVRGTFTPVDSILTLKGEVARQFGEATTTADFKGWGGYLGAEFGLSGDLMPKFVVQYTYMTGQDPTDTDVSLWIPVFPSDVASRVGKIAYASMFGLGESVAVMKAGPNVYLTGIQALKLGFSMNATEKLGMAVDFYNLRANESGTFGSSFGNELDLGFTYMYSEDVNFGLDLGYFMTAGFVDDYTGSNDKNAWQAVASMKVKF